MAAPFTSLPATYKVAGATAVCQFPFPLSFLLLDPLLILFSLTSYFLRGLQVYIFKIRVLCSQFYSLTKLSTKIGPKHTRTTTAISQAITLKAPLPNLEVSGAISRVSVLLSTTALIENQFFNTAVIALICPDPWALGVLSSFTHSKVIAPSPGGIRG